MADATPGATARPKKKFGGFKKAAWQTAAPKAEGQPQDMFSHSNDFRDLVAEEVKRKADDRKRAESKRAEEQSRKKRKASAEMDEDCKPGSGRSRSSIGRSNTSLSPAHAPVDTLTRSADSLADRYDTLTRSDSCAKTNVIDLGDSDDDDDEDASVASLSPPRQSIPARPTRRALSLEVEEGEDPRLVELRAKARAKAAAHASALRKEEQKGPVVQLMMHSEIPGTNPLIVKVRLDTTLERPKEAWCGRQQVTPKLDPQNVFITFNLRRIYNTTKVARLGLRDLGNGCVKMEGDESIYDEENLARPRVQLWTEEVFRQYQRQQAEEAAEAKKAAEPPPIYAEPEPEREPEPVAKIRLFLKAKNKEVLKVIVRPDTTVSQLTQSYKTSRHISADQPITLMFDDERLKPMDVVSDYDIEDEDSIDVYFK
ncbi:hypothetical protein P280DRAFT_466934 [Massarina eburnea CBS 473.64]|uniref:Ubiquitin-like domain-containing protein n=1 Tax=Massarina eburnea CBS 473.64 TaxID=1395130 RepID=A0A6A6S954_9PLEO|nr:hypothetical protein P280DRAFT_466934 [Massarina eburnea CBS 473.64]